MPPLIDSPNIKFEQSAMAIVLYNENILVTVELIYGKEILSLPKGHKEENEELVDTAIRECFEETNVVLTKENFVKELLPYSYEFQTPSKQLIKKTVFPFLFTVNSEGDPRPKEKRIVSVQWMSIEQFVNNCTLESVKNLVKSIK